MRQMQPECNIHLKEREEHKAPRQYLRTWRPRRFSCEAGGTGGADGSAGAIRNAPAGLLGWGAGFTTDCLNYFNCGGADRKKMRQFGCAHRKGAKNAKCGSNLCDRGALCDSRMNPAVHCPRRGLGRRG